MAQGSFRFSGQTARMHLSSLEGDMMALNSSESVSSTGTEWVPRIQVRPDHYKSSYDDWDKWTCYFWQIRNVIERGIENVLEIGIGSQVVTRYLRANNINLTTLDIDPSLDPDYVGSVTELPFPANSFDGVLCTEVLEHMPFEKTCRAIGEICRVTRRYAFV